MKKDIEVGDYLLCLEPVPVEDAGYAVRVRVTRLDKQALHGASYADDSGAITGGHGPFETVGDAIAHGEAWGRHYVARVLGHAV